jgi:cysteine desulfuration protein SufE
MPLPRRSIFFKISCVVIPVHIDSSALLEKQRQRLADLFMIGEPQQRLARLIHEAPKQPKIEAALRIDANRVEGCLVRVWLVPEFREGKCFFRCDSDAVSLKVVGSLLCQLYSGYSPEEIGTTNFGVLKHLGILPQLAENRQRTVARIEEKIRRFAQEHQTKVV